MNSKVLEAFIEIYKCRSLNKAAKTLFMTPQGLSRLLQNLEDDMGVCLFVRSQRGVIPTHFGETLYEHSINILDSINLMYREIKQDSGNYISVLRVASVTGLLAYVTIDFINDFRAMYPNIALEVIDGSDQAVDTKLWDEQVEVGFLAGPIDTVRYNASLFTRHYHCLVINKEHPLSNKERIEYEDLDGEPLALVGRHSVPYHNNMSRFLRAGVMPKIILEVTEIDLVHQIAAMNKGIGLSVDFPAFASQRSNTVIRPFADENCTRETYLVTKKGILLSKEAQIFQEFAFDWLARNDSRLFEWRPYD